MILNIQVADCRESKGWLLPTAPWPARTQPHPRPPPPCDMRLCRPTKPATRMCASRANGALCGATLRPLSRQVMTSRSTMPHYCHNDVASKAGTRSAAMASSTDLTRQKTRLENTTAPPVTAQSLQSKGAAKTARRLTTSRTRSSGLAGPAVSDPSFPKVFVPWWRAVSARTEVHVQVPGLVGKSMVKMMALRQQQRKGSVPVTTRMRLASYHPLTKLTPIAWRAHGAVQHDSCGDKTLT